MGAPGTIAAVLGIVAAAGLAGATAIPGPVEDALDALPVAQHDWDDAIQLSPLPDGHAPITGQQVPAVPWPGVAVPDVRTQPVLDAPLDEAAPATLAPDRVVDAAVAAGQRGAAALPPAEVHPAVPATDAAPAIADVGAALDVLPLWAPYDALWYAASPQGWPSSEEADAPGAPHLARPGAPPASPAAEEATGPLEPLRAGGSPGADPAKAPAARTFAMSGGALSHVPGDAGPAALLLAVGAGAALLVLARPLLALYHRVAPSRLLEQPTRRALYDAIAGEPGLRIGTLQARLGLNYNTVRRHVVLLERGGFIRPAGPGQRRWFPSGAGPAEERAALARATPASRRVLAVLAEAGPMDAQALARRLGLPRSTLGDVVARLASAELVRTQRSGNRLRVGLP